MTHFILAYFQGRRATCKQCLNGLKFHQKFVAID